MARLREQGKDRNGRKTRRLMGSEKGKENVDEDEEMSSGTK
jgi:hypothetical protein